MYMRLTMADRYISREWLLKELSEYKWLERMVGDGGI